jgi:hypothetical protein
MLKQLPFPKHPQHVPEHAQRFPNTPQFDEVDIAWYLLLAVFAIDWDHHLDIHHPGNSMSFQADTAGVFSVLMVKPG